MVCEAQWCTKVKDSRAEHLMPTIRTSDPGLDSLMISVVVARLLCAAGIPFTIQTFSTCYILATQTVSRQQLRLIIPLETTRIFLHLFFITACLVLPFNHWEVRLVQQHFSAKQSASISGISERRCPNSGTSAFNDSYPGNGLSMSPMLAIMVHI